MKRYLILIALIISLSGCFPYVVWDGYYDHPYPVYHYSGYYDYRGYYGPPSGYHYRYYGPTRYYYVR